MMNSISDVDNKKIRIDDLPKISNQNLSYLPSLHKKVKAQTAICRHKKCIFLKNALFVHTIYKELSNQYNTQWLLKQSLDTRLFYRLTFTSKGNTLLQP